MNSGFDCRHFIQSSVYEPGYPQHLFFSSSGPAHDGAGGQVVVTFDLQALSRQRPPSPVCLT